MALHFRLILETVGHSLIQNFWQRAKRRLKCAAVVSLRWKQFLGCAFVAAAIYLPLANVSALQTPDQEYEAVAEEFIKGYFAARPLLGTSIGLHEYDGKISDYSRLALDAELSRLKRFEDRLQKFDLAKLSQRQSIDLRILQAAIRKEIFQREAMSIYERDPMVYARSADVNI